MTNKAPRRTTWARVVFSNPSASGKTTTKSIQVDAWDLAIALPTVYNAVANDNQGFTRSHLQTVQFTVQDEQGHAMATSPEFIAMPADQAVNAPTHKEGQPVRVYFDPDTYAQRGVVA